MLKNQNFKGEFLIGACPHLEEYECSKNAANSVLNLAGQYGKMLKHLINLIYWII